MKYLLLLLTASCATQALESRHKIVVIDTGVNSVVAHMKYMCKDGIKNFTRSSNEDVNGHGSHIVNIIGTRVNSNKYCISSYKVFHDKDGGVNSTVNALKEISKDTSVRYVNISMNGYGSNREELAMVEELTRKGIKFTVAAGNERKLITKGDCTQYPACYKLFITKPNNFYVVGAIGDFSNYGPIVDVVVNGTIKSLGYVRHGTSQASASYAATIINAGNRNDK
jgi:hypothetical protein